MSSGRAYAVTGETGKPFSASSMAGCNTCRSQNRLMLQTHLVSDPGTPCGAARRLSDSSASDAGSAHGHRAAWFDILGKWQGLAGFSKV